MAKFVEVHKDGKPVMFNLDKVVSVFQGLDGKVYFDIVSIDEKYEEVKKIIGAAQGGIPMEPGRMYDGA